MTNQEAIMRVREFGLHHAIRDLPNSSLTVRAFEMAISALEEVQKYQEIGTIDECQNAIGKQKSKIPNVWGDGYDDKGNMIYDMYTCPNCGENYEIDYDHYEYCPKCGQHMDKSNKVFE